MKITSLVEVQTLCRIFNVQTTFAIQKFGIEVHISITQPVTVFLKLGIDGDHVIVFVFVVWKMDGKKLMSLGIK